MDHFAIRTQEAIESAKILAVKIDAQSSAVNELIQSVKVLNAAVIDLQSRLSKLEYANANRQRQAARSN